MDSDGKDKQFRTQTLKLSCLHAIQLSTKAQPDNEQNTWYIFHCVWWYWSNIWIGRGELTDRVSNLDCYVDVDDE